MPTMRVSFTFADWEGCAAEDDTMEFDAAMWQTLSAAEKISLLDKAEHQKGRYWCSDNSIEIFNEILIE